MSSGGYREPPIDKASSRAIVETIVGNSNQKVGSGNWIVHKARIISGNLNRFYSLIDHLEGLGVDSVALDKLRVSIASNSIGFAPELPPYGMRGEAIAIITQQQLPKKETVTNTSGGLIRRSQPAPAPITTEEAQQR